MGALRGFRRASATMIATALVLAGCDPADTPEDDETSSDDGDVASDDGGDPEPAPEPEPDPIEVATWTAEDLPPVAGYARVVDNLAVLFAHEDTELLVIAIDIRTGEEVWRATAHHHGRLTRTVHTPSVDDDHDRVYLTVFDDDTSAIELVGLDLHDGSELWRAGTEWAGSPPLACGDDTMCIVSWGGGISVHARDGGTLLDRVDAGLPLAVGGNEDMLVTTGNEGMIEVGDRSSDGYAQRWRVTFEQIWGDDGAHFTPDVTWYVSVLEDSGTVAAWIPASSPEDWDDGEPNYLTDGGFALLDADGEVITTHTGVASCFNDEYDLDVFVLCGDLDTVEVSEVDEQLRAGFDPDLPVGIFTTVFGVDAVTGEVVWELDLPAPVGRYGPGVSLAGDDGLWHVRAIDGSEALLDPTDGTLEEVTDDVRDLIVPCPEDDVDDRLWFDLATHGGETDRYVRLFAGDVAPLCDLAGDQRSPEELFAINALPSWFGIVDRGDDDIDDLGDADDDNQGDAQSWTLWATPDGVLHGLGPAED